MKFSSDIDIDFSNREDILKHIKHIPASMYREGELSKHNSGVYFTKIPVDPVLGISSIHYEQAEEFGYIKLDFLNVAVYNQVKDENHLITLMNTEPPWDKIYDSDFCSKVIHIGAHYDILVKMPEAVNSIPRLAMFLAVIRPGKRHLVGKPWQEVAKTVWEKPSNGSYAFKKSHAISYSHLVAIHMNLLNE
jgi:hypothetical protein